MGERDRRVKEREAKFKTNLLLKTYIGSLDQYIGFFLCQEVSDLKNK